MPQLLLPFGLAREIEAATSCFTHITFFLTLELDVGQTV
ncbi:unnamed protein product, partial [marine sediment metagenome]